MAIAFDTEIPGQAIVANSITISYTGAVGASLVVNTQVESGTVTGVTYAGNNLTAAGQTTSTTLTVAQHYGIGVIADAGAHNIVVSLSALVNARAMGISYTGAASVRGSGETAVGSGSTASRVATSATDEMVVANVAANSATVTLTPNGTLLYGTDRTGLISTAGQQTLATGSSATMSWSMTESIAWVVAALALQPSAASEPYELEAGRHFISGFNAVP